MAEDMVTLKLTGPVTQEQAARLNAKEVKNYPSPGMEITVPRASAEALINAGYCAGVDPNDKGAVARTLRVSPSAAAANAAPSVPEPRSEPVKASKPAKG